MSIFSIPASALTPLQLALKDVETPETLGAIKTGVSRKKGTAAVFSTNQTPGTVNPMFARTGLSTIHPRTTPPSALHTTVTSLGNIEEAALQLIDTALADVHVRSGIAPAELRNHFKNFKPKEYLKRQQDPTMAWLDSDLDHALWLLCSTLAAMPAGIDLIKRHMNPGWSLSEAENRTLEILAKAQVHVEGSKRPAQPLAHLLHRCKNQQGIPMKAIETCVAELSGNVVLARWAKHAFRNGLCGHGINTDFLRIDRRLQKLGVWLQRAERTPRYKRLLPALNKTPFRSLRFGTMGSDLNDIAVQRAELKEGAQRRTATRSAQRHKPKRQLVLGQLHHVVDRIQGASRWKMLSGGTLGIGSKGITAAITNLLSGLILRLKIDVRWARTRMAGIELAMPPYNMELMLYSATQHAAQAGAGVAAGPAIGPLEFTGGVDVKAISREAKQLEGVVLRMPRLRGQEKELRTRFKCMLSRLFELSTRPLKDGELLTTLLEEFPELTANWIGEATENRQHHSASIEANAGLLTGSAKCAVTAELGVEYQSRIQKTHRDKNGAIRVERQTLGRGLKAFAEARLDVRINGTNEPARMGVLTLEGLAASVDFLSAGRQIRQDIVYEDERISTVSFYEIEYQSFDDFKHAVLSELEHWVNAKKDLENPRDKILQFLQHAAENRQTRHTFAARCELRKETAREIDLLNSIIKMNQYKTDSASIESVHKARAAVQALLQNPAAYAPTSFRVYDRQEIARQRGLHAGARMEAVDMAEGVYAHTRLM